MNITDPSGRRAREKVALSAGLRVETERLLSGRTRDIKLSGELVRLYRSRSWPQRSKIVRAWAIWVSALGLSGIALATWRYPNSLMLTLVLYGGLVPAVNSFGVWVWRRPRKAWIEGLTVVLLVVGTTIAISGLGIQEGGADAERHVTASLFVALSAIMLLGVDRFWSAMIGIYAILGFLCFQLLNPAVPPLAAVVYALFYGSGVTAVVLARGTITLLAQKSFLLSLRDEYRSAAMAETNRRLEELATRDPMTGLANRRSIALQIENIWQDETIPKSGIAFIMADIDRFKHLNDTRGHPAGDQCIQRVAQTIATSLRSGEDIASRYGGEEFLIVLVGVTAEQALALAERVRANVEALAIPNSGAAEADGHEVVTLSLGVAFADDNVSQEQVTQWADAALYHSKRNGRNRVSLSGKSQADSDLAPPLAPALGGNSGQELSDRVDRRLTS